jgi:hypothetical protein
MARLRETGDVVDLDHALFLVDGVEDAVPASSQTSQVWRPVSKRFPRARLAGELADAIPECSDASGIVARKPAAWSRARISQLT